MRANKFLPVFPSQLANPQIADSFQPITGETG
jgi:hypothetical protein